MNKLEQKPQLHPSASLSVASSAVINNPSCLSLVLSCCWSNLQDICHPFSALPSYTPHKTSFLSILLQFLPRAVTSRRGAHFLQCSCRLTPMCTESPNINQHWATGHLSTPPNLQFFMSWRSCSGNICILVISGMGCGVSFGCKDLLFVLYLQVIGFLSALLGKEGNKADIMRQKPHFIRKVTTATNSSQQVVINPVIKLPGCQELVKYIENFG